VVVIDEGNCEKPSEKPEMETSLRGKRDKELEQY